MASAVPPIRTSLGILRRDEICPGNARGLHAPSVPYPRLSSLYRDFAQRLPAWQ